MQVDCPREGRVAHSFATVTQTSVKDLTSSKLKFLKTHPRRVLSLEILFPLSSSLTQKSSDCTMEQPFRFQTLLCPVICLNSPQHVSLYFQCCLVHFHFSYTDVLLFQALFDRCWCCCEFNLKGFSGSHRLVRTPVSGAHGHVEMPCEQAFECVPFEWGHICF